MYSSIANNCFSYLLTLDEISGVIIEVLNGTTSMAKGKITGWNANSSYVIEFEPKTKTFKTTSVNLGPVKTLITNL